jgi:epoxyqueuosine reductase QueG
MELSKRTKDSGTWITLIIKRFIAESPENTLKDEKNEKAWGEPIVGFSNGADSLYQFYKEDIGQFYLTPSEAFARVFPKMPVEPNQLTVISWILPHTETTKSEHRKQNALPTERWARARIFGEEVNDRLRMHVITRLFEAGFEAVAPGMPPLFRSEKSQKYLNASTWSERHAAYAAGLGTFGLCDGLITPIGKAIRCGSVIAKVNIQPSTRRYSDRHAYCLFYSKGVCGKCIDRCPVGAISKEGHDKIKCSKHLEATREYVQTHYGFKGYGCGLCQTRVPCESRIPKGIDCR